MKYVYRYKRLSPYKLEPLAMALRKISDLKPVFTGDNVIEWQSPSGTRYRYERDRCAVGQETIPGSECYDWHVLAKSDVTHAKRRVFELINEDEF
ncbi:hypothetical protein BDK62_10139 [Halomonas alkaliantarctica]|nr:hypothetical protein BDK62_10139 [Halomonas alkaliantarctica]